MRITMLLLLAILLQNVHANEVHHIVLFKLKETVTAKQIDEMEVVAEALLGDIPGVLEVSLNRKARDNREVHIKDYDVALYVRWERNAVGNVYGPHVLHQSSTCRWWRISG